MKISDKNDLVFHRPEFIKAYWRKDKDARADDHTGPPPLRPRAHGPAGPQLNLEAHAALVDDVAIANEGLEEHAGSGGGGGGAEHRRATPSNRKQSFMDRPIEGAPQLPVETYRQIASDYQSKHGIDIRFNGGDGNPVLAR